MQDLQQMRELRDVAVETVLKFLKEEDVSTEGLQKARLAMSALATYSRVKQTARTWASMRFIAAKTLLENKEALEEYVATSLPELHLNKALELQMNERKQDRAKIAAAGPGPFKTLGG